jgi:hypothetical protein
MPNPRCDRTWQVEAKLDGRLDEAASAALDVHARTCDACGHALASPRNDAADRDLTNGYARGDDQAPRRPTLRAVEADVVADDESFAGVPAILTTLAAIATLGALAAQLVQRRPTDEFATRHSDAHAAYAANGVLPVARPSLRVTLSDGHAVLDVPAMPGAPKVVLSLPDGELELDEAQLDVVVEGSKTRGLRVVKGTVSLSPSARHDTLPAGDAWRSSASETPSTSKAATRPSTLTRDD